MININIGITQRNLSHALLQAEQLGIKLEDVGETDPEGVLQDQGLDLDLLMAEENASRTKDQTNITKNLAKEQQKMMSENMNTTLV